VAGGARRAGDHGVLMLVLVSGATATHRRYAGTPYFGHLVTPSGGHRMAPIIEGGRPWAADNDFFWKPDPIAFRSMLGRLAGLPGCRFVACPDSVGDASRTLEMFEEWEPEIESFGLPVALVGQDGAEERELPWDRMSALFVGGSTSWKESHSAMSLCDEAKRRGKWVHVGRVNTLRRLRKVFDWGTVDSIDGTCFSKWPDKFFPWFMRNIAELSAQPKLF
jgi:hypothetical protein